MEQVEGVQEDACIVLVEPDAIKDRQAIFIARNGLPIDRKARRLQRLGSLHYQWKALRPVVAITGDDTDRAGMPTDHHPKAVMLDFVEPPRAARWSVGNRWKARLNGLGLQFGDAPAKLTQYSRHAHS